MSKYIVKAIFILSLISASANAALITMDDKKWNITWINDSFNNLNNDSSLEAQPWWGNESSAVDFANALGYIEDYDDDGGFGPKFAFANENSNVSWANTTLSSGHSVEEFPVEDMPLAYAYAQLLEPILINGQLWDISWVIGSFTDLNANSLLESQAWWGDENLAIDFANAFGYMDDGDEDQGFGPKFAFNNEGSNISWANTTLPSGYSVESFPAADMSLAYAFAERVQTVPEPSSYILFSIALLIAGYRKSLK